MGLRVSARGWAALRAHSDLEVFQTALHAGRVVVTNNVADFESLRRAHEAAGNQLPGLIYTSDTAFPSTKAFAEQIAAALCTAATTREVHTHGGVLRLRRAWRLTSTQLEPPFSLLLALRQVRFALSMNLPPSSRVR